MENTSTTSLYCAFGSYDSLNSEMLSCFQPYLLYPFHPAKLYMQPIAVHNLEGGIVKTLLFVGMKPHLVKALCMLLK